MKISSPGQVYMEDNLSSKAHAFPPSSFPLKLPEERERECVYVCVRRWGRCSNTAIPPSLHEWRSSLLYKPMSFWQFSGGWAASSWWVSSIEEVIQCWPIKAEARTTQRYTIQQAPHLRAAGSTKDAKKLPLACAPLWRQLPSMFFNCFFNQLVCYRCRRI